MTLPAKSASSAASTPTLGFSSSPRRLEDGRLVTGAGRFPSDLADEGMLHAAVVRSQAAHGTFRLDGLNEARAMPGVAAILTHDDVAELGTLPAAGFVKNRDGSPVDVPPYTVLPKDRIRHVGEALAFVVAKTAAQARDAAEAVQVEIDQLPATSGVDEAIQPDAPLVWPERGSNIAYDSIVGDPSATAKAFEKAARVVEIDLINNRLIANYMEPRSALARYDRKTQSFTLSLGSQGVHAIRRMLCDNVFRIPHEKMRVITPPDVGGGFGTRYFLYREYALVCVAAKKLSKPVRWLSDRGEHFLADAHGRDHHSRARLALNERGRMLALDIDILANLGAYQSFYGAFVPFNGASMSPGCYDIPAVSARVRGVYTHTVPTDAYRGAGRPEATFLIERLADKAARELGQSPAAFRRRNFIKPEAMPHKTATGRTYDSGEFDGHMTRAMEAADWKSFSARLKASRKRGMLRGIGLASYIEACAGPVPETARLEIADDGRATIYIGYQATGQGHETVYAQLAAAHTGIPMEAFSLVQGDTALVATGSGTGGSRSVTIGGVVVDEAAKILGSKIRKHASRRLEAGEADIELANGFAVVAGTDRRISIANVASAARQAGDPLEADYRWGPPDFTFPNGTHIVEVEIDPATGVVAPLAYTVVDDFGRTVNPLLLEGQIHGGIAQGLGQALLERTVYEPGSAQLLSATFQDYAMPRADDLCMISFETRNVPCRNNLAGMKGAGEAGTIGATPAVMNAVIDALHRHNGTTHIDMPATPEVVWRSIRAAPAGGGRG